jgi:hypothetical protein
MVLPGTAGLLTEPCADLEGFCDYIAGDNQDTAVLALSQLCHTKRVRKSAENFTGATAVSRLPRRVHLL